jgi:hypothetical protein
MKKQFSEIGSIVFIITSAIFLITTPLHSQPKKGMYGLTTTIAKGFIASHDITTMGGVLNGSLNIGMAYMPSDKFSLRGELGFRSQKDTNNTKNSEFTFTGNLWYYLQTSESVSTFLGGGIGFGSANTASGDGTNLLSLSGYFGAEYWFSPHFSCFGHIGIVYASYSVATKPASDIFTSATTGLTWYF